MLRLRPACLLLTATLAFAGCASSPKAVQLQGPDAAKLVPVIAVGRPLEDVVLALGTPAREFESGRILCFLLRYDADRKELVPVPRNVSPFAPDHLSWKWVEYDLVVVFDGNRRLERYSLVRL